MGELQPIPFLHSEKFSAQGDVERYLSKLTFSGDKLDYSRLLAYDKLPLIWSAKGIETYANSLVENSRQDPDKVEFGGWVHLLSPGNLIYPDPPTRGTIKYENGVFYYSIKPERHFQPGLYPLVFEHSHVVKNKPFSDTDIYLMVGSDQEVNPVICIAATSGWNYMMARTQEAQNSPWSDIVKRYYEFRDGLHERVYSYGERLEAALGVGSEEYVNSIFDHFDGSPADYYLGFALINKLAQHYKFGYYCSQRDGNYILVNDDFIEKHMEEKMEQAVNY